MVGAENIQFSQSEIYSLMLSVGGTRGFRMTNQFAYARRDIFPMNESPCLRAAG
jgi:hypothetical protein